MTDALQVPGRYGAWVSWLEAFARGEDLPTGHLAPVDDAMGPHMQGRLLARVARAYEARAALWGTALQRDLDHATGTGAHAAALVDARARLVPLACLAASPLLPEQVRAALHTSLSTMVDSAQRSLEDSARRGLSPTTLLAVVRDNALSAALRPPTMPPPVTTPSASNPPPRGRRVIL